MTDEHGGPPGEIVARLQSLCRALPEVYEEAAWTGTRWMVRKQNLAQVVWIEAGWPPAYARAAGTDGPCCVLTFRCPVEDVEAFRQAGHPYFVPVWFPNIVGMTLDGRTDWDEVAELITDSYLVLAPATLTRLVELDD